MDSRSSLAARRAVSCGSAAWVSSAKLGVCGAGDGSRDARHGGSGMVSSPAAAADGAAGAGTGSVSRTLSASWIAESAASVGSLIFFGVFAISLVASYYAGPEQRRERSLTALRARLSLEIPSGTPSGSRQSRAAQTIHRRSAILSAWHTEGNCLLRRL